MYGRKEEVRNVEGVPVLKRGSRGKGVAVSIQAVAAAVARSAKQGQSIGLQIAALQILGLKQVQSHLFHPSFVFFPRVRYV